MRSVLALALAALLSACSGDEAPVAKAGDRIACALGGSTTFVADCVVERVQRDGALTLVVHHPDGGFRRFAVLKDGRGLAEADGTHPGVATIAGQFLEIRVGRDRYRFPFKPSSGAPVKPPEAAGTSVACAPHGAKAYAEQCLLERAADGLVLRHPDGGFRRFVVKGERIAAADGADVTEVERADGEVALSVGADSYLIPQRLLSNERQ